VVVRLDSHGLLFRPGRQSQTVGGSCADFVDHAGPVVA
jgi:hypothetical protein